MNPRNRNILIIAIVVIVVALAAFFTLFNKKDSQSNASTSSDKIVKVGIMSGSKELDEMWETITKTAKDKYGITVKLTHFTDYTQPNSALKNGDIDVNAFQHYAFLKAWNKANNANLTPIGDTVISPIRLYSNKIKSIKDVSNGATISIPNDATNESRALYALKNAGLIGLDTSGGVLATIKNINSNPKNIVFKELDAAQLPRSLDSVEASVINDNFAQAAKLNPKDAIFVEPVNKDSQQWINVIAVNEKDKDKEVYKNLVKAFQDQATKDTIEKVYPSGSTIPAWGLKL